MNAGTERRGTMSLLAVLWIASLLTACSVGASGSLLGVALALGAGCAALMWRPHAASAGVTAAPGELAEREDASAAAREPEAQEARIVALFRFEPSGRDPLRASVVYALERAGFAAQGIRVPLGRALSLASCDAPSEACAPELARWLANNSQVSCAYAFGELTVGPARQGVTRRFVLYDLERARVIRQLWFTPTEDDLIGPLMFPETVARALREHEVPPSPITEEEREELANLDSVPVEEIDAHPCLSIVNTETRYEPPPLPPGRAGAGCHIGEEPDPGGMLTMTPLVGLALAARRRRARHEALERVLSRGQLPPDVVARLRTRHAEREPS